MHDRNLTSERLALARHFRGITQQILADEVGVSAAAISQFESGTAVPSQQTAERLSMALKVTSTFLTRPSIVRARSRPFFRALQRTPAHERRRAASYALLLAELGELLDEHVELPEIQIHQLIDASASTSDEVIEAAAIRARHVWEVRQGPIADVINLAETRGVLVAAVGEFPEGMDAFSLRTSARSVVVLCTEKGIAARRRFDMAHELGHLVLHRDRDRDQRQQERQAHRFASALLMPEEDVVPFLPRRANDLVALEDAAKIWGVSMQAVLFRAKDLGVLSDHDYGRTMRRISAAGWRTREPVEIGPPERPALLLRAAAALTHAGTSLGALAEKLGLPEGRLRRMISLPEDQGEPRANVLNFRTRAVTTG